MNLVLCLFCLQAVCSPAFRAHVHDLLSSQKKLDTNSQHAEQDRPIVERPDPQYILHRREQLLRDPLPPKYQQMLARGQLWSALILSTFYIEHGGQSIRKVGMNAHVDSPFENSQPSWSTENTLLDTIGNRYAVAYLWKSTGRDRTVYVIFNPARGLSHILWHIYRGWKMVESEQDGISMSGYLKRKLNQLWDGGLSAALQKVTRELHDHTIIFAGLSFGSTMAQATAYRFARSLPGWAAEGTDLPEYYVCAYNSLPWTNAQGVEDVNQVFGDRLVVFANTLRKGGKRVWDTNAGYRFGSSFTPMTRIRLLETGCDSGKEPEGKQTCGDMLKCDAAQGCPGNPFMPSSDFHDASITVPGIRAATRRADQEIRKRFPQGERGSTVCPDMSKPITDPSTCRIFAGSTQIGYDASCETSHAAPDWCTGRPLGCWQDQAVGVTIYKGFGQNVGFDNAKPVCARTRKVTFSSDVK